MTKDEQNGMITRRAFLTGLITTTALVPLALYRREETAEFVAGFKRLYGELLATPTSRVSYAGNMQTVWWKPPLDANGA